jgi:hypothetical protein
MKFQATILQNGKTATGIPVTEAVVEALGGGKRAPVRVTLNQYTYRSSIASVDGMFMISLSGENRAAAGVAAGEQVEVEIELDTQPREVTVPPDLREALDQDTRAKTFFESLSYSGKLRFVLPVEQAKTPETRQRRIEKTLSDLREGRK